QGVDLAEVASGKYDAYLRSYAKAVRAYGHTVIIGFAHEMNGYWYSWGLDHTSPATWISAWRHIVATFRDGDVRNVIWLWTVNRLGGKIGHTYTWWPGASYVTWIGIDGYYYQRENTFYDVFGPTITEIRRFTGKPILLAETAVGQRSGQAAKIPGLF